MNSSELLKPQPVAINGFGSIGVCLAMILNDRPEFDLVAINNGDMKSTALDRAEITAKPFRSSSDYGWYREQGLNFSEGMLHVDGKDILSLGFRDRLQAPWAEIAERVGSLIVFEATDGDKNRENLEAHLKAGASLVLGTAPTKDPSIPTLIKGVTDSPELLKEAVKQRIEANSSCSSTALSTKTKALTLWEDFEIVKAHTVITHAVTGSQPTKDTKGTKASERRSADAIVPASTGSAKELHRMFPQFESFTATSKRVPVSTGSVGETTYTMRGPVTKEDVIDAFNSAIQGDLEGLLKWSNYDEEMTSEKIRKAAASVVLSKKSIRATYSPRLDITEVGIDGWFDNQWGYSCRVVDMAYDLSQLMKNS